MDLRDLIEREIEQYLEWPTADKSHVTTVSAKLFAEHVARLHADHIHDDAPQPAERQPAGYDFIQASKLCEQGLNTWKEKPHNKRWWKRIDGTPIPNDLLCCIAEAFTAGQPVKPAEQQPAADVSAPVVHTFYVLHDATEGQKYIKKDVDDGCLAIFDREEDARRAKRRHPGTEYKRVDYYAAPQPAEQHPDVTQLVEALTGAFEYLVGNTGHGLWRDTVIFQIEEALASCRKGFDV